MARGSIVCVCIVAILIVIFAWTCSALAGGDGGTTKKSEPVQSVLEEPVQHTEQSTEDDDSAHDHEKHPSFLHEATQTLIGKLAGAGAMILVAVLGYLGLRAKFKKE